MTTTWQTTGKELVVPYSIRPRIIIYYFVPVLFRTSTSIISYEYEYEYE